MFTLLALAPSMVTFLAVLATLVFHMRTPPCAPQDEPDTWALDLLAELAEKPVALAPKPRARRPYTPRRRPMGVPTPLCVVSVAPTTDPMTSRTPRTVRLMLPCPPTMRCPMLV